MAGANAKQLRDNLANYDAQLDQVSLRGEVVYCILKFASCSRWRPRLLMTLIIQSCQNSRRTFQ